MTLVAIPLFPRFTALDAVGPYEVLQRIPSIDVVFVGSRRDEMRTENGMLGLACDATFDDVDAPDVVVVPGGIGTRELIRDDGGGAIGGWLRSVHPTTAFTTSVCTGALLLAAAGLLDGLTATTHWRAAELLNDLGARYVPTRVVEHLPQRIITAAGVSSGIDMALRLVELLVDRQAAQAAQLLIEYDPQPPFDAGALAKADEATVARANEYLQARR
ncbi:thiamine biosynthesis protein ThiJ [Mycobacterium alsense]|uniref:DJ-1/PfpI family protein n=1 Tax=Mycobacterium alsense TaxID=324058 RepID=UPI000800F474|nr:DJ-1/PfpI family protein [Mycobacterium alsense]OBJ03942.1 thiamine biosynthesis protein ThiJ [Mycobacterium alsense]